MAEDSTAKVTPKNPNQENDESDSKSQNDQFGDFEEKTTATTTKISDSAQKSVKLKRKKVPEVLLIKPENQKILEKRIKIECNDSKIPPIKLPEPIKVDDGKTKIVTAKPPLPPKKVPKLPANQSKLKRKFEDESSHQIQKLTAANDQLRLENTELKILLQNEKVVSRRLR